MKYYLIRENIVGDEKDLGNCLISIDKSVELTKIELEFIIEDHLVNYDPFKLKDKLRKVLNNGKK